MENKKQTLKEQRDKQEFERQIVSEITADFKKRQKIRKPIERQWELNMNFVSGNQYTDIDKRGEITDCDKDYYWQSREVFNHIAPIVETRLAKFSRVSPNVSVRPDSDDDKDVSRALLAEKLILEAFKKNNLVSISKTVNAWAEICGTAFYKIVWDNVGGNIIGELNGQTVFEGEVKILPISPFEIFPDSIYTENLDDCKSIIHAKAVNVEEIYVKYGVRVAGEDVDAINLSVANNRQLNGEDDRKMQNCAVVIERYELPCAEYPNGRLITVAGGKLLYLGDLPYVNRDNGKRGYPFIKQVCLPKTGCFFGKCIVDRLIPVQRAYNAVKNRKHEFINRLSMGVMTVEDGAVDTEDLTEEGLSPGKVLVYRQGYKAPEMMSENSLPPDFKDEEERLLNEFIIISGVSDVASSKENATVSSGTALEILVEQDNERLTMNAEIIRSCFLDVARQCLKLYAQFISGVRVVKYLDAFNKTKVCYANEQCATSCDVYLDSENELEQTPSKKREMILKLFNSGILHDENGVLRHQTKEKVLSLLGYKDLDYQKGLSRLQEEKAQIENETIRKSGATIEDFDDDVIHIDEHIRYVLSEYVQLSKEEKLRFTEHIKAHKDRIKTTQNVNREI